MLQAGIVGLPNVGKSTLFNAMTRSRKADAQNYPFCTIEPNVGIVEVPDGRLEKLATLAKSARVVPAAIEMVDIAGLVAGASRGEGLGNKFLAHIREVDAIVHVVRCFENSTIVHGADTIDPVRDIGTVATELLLADLQSVENQLNKCVKKAKGGDREAGKNVELLRALQTHLDAGNPAISLPMDGDAVASLKPFNLLTAKPVIFACNVADMAAAANPFVDAVVTYGASQSHTACCVLCAQLEADMVDFSAEEAAEFLGECGVDRSGVGGLIEKTYAILGLASFFTTGEDETRAWTFRVGMRAPQCAGVIHGDFEDGFIRAEVIGCDELLASGGWAEARNAGKIRIEGKDYRFSDGDVALFRCGV